MNRLVPVALLFVLTATLALAEPQERVRRTDRKAIISLLQREGIVGEKARVTDVSWAGEFWIVAVRHADGSTTNWHVDATTRDYSYICQH